MDLLSGVIDPITYSEPRCYTTVIRDGKVTISEPGKTDIEMNLEQYDEWKKTVSDRDLLFETELADLSEELIVITPGNNYHAPFFHVLQQGNDPLPDENELQAQYETSKPIEATTPAEVPKPRKTKRKGLLKWITEGASKPEEVKEEIKPLATGQKRGIRYANSSNDDFAFQMQRHLNTLHKW